MYSLDNYIIGNLYRTKLINNSLIDFTTFNLLKEAFGFKGFSTYPIGTLVIYLRYHNNSRLHYGGNVYHKVLIGNKIGFLSTNITLEEMGND